MKRSAPAAGLSLPPRKSHPLRSFFLGTEPAPALSPALSPTQPAAASPAASASTDDPTHTSRGSTPASTDTPDPTTSLHLLPATATAATPTATTTAASSGSVPDTDSDFILLPSIPVGVTVSDSAQSSVSESVLASIAASVSASAHAAGPYQPLSSHSDAAPYVPLPESAQDHIFRNLRLRRIVKENHGSEIQHCVFFTPPPTDDEAGGGRGPAAGTDASNVLATIGGSQVNFYDNEHCGDHLDIMAHFSLDDEPVASAADTCSPAKEILACCWLRYPDDAVLAAAGGDKLIHILSLATSSEIKILAGHEGKIMDLQAHPLDDNLLLSCSTDGTARLWHLDSGRCVCTYAVHATALSFHPSGQSFVTGSFSGSVHQWRIPDTLLFLSTPAASALDTIRVTDGEMLTATLHSNQIDCIRFVGDCVLSKSTSGKMALWDAESKQTIHSFHLRGGSNRCRFDVTRDGRYVCVGTAVGTVSVYSLVTGRLISELRHKRSNKAVRCCAFSRHQRNIVFAGEDSFIWRFDYRPADSESVSR